MTDDYEYFKNKRTDRVYLSKSMSQKQYRKNDEGEVEEFERPFRIVSKVIDCTESHQFFKDGKQVSLRITDGQRQEIKAKFCEDTRGVSTLNIQKNIQLKAEPLMALTLLLPATRSPFFSTF